MTEQVDEMNFALDGLQPWRPLRIRRASLLSLLTICSMEEGRRQINERGSANMIIDAILDMNFDDSVSSVGAAALFYILASDAEDVTLLDSPACVRFLLKLLNPPINQNVEKKKPKIGFNLVEIHKLQTLSANEGLDSTSRAIISKVKELLICNEIKSASDDDDGMQRPELSSKWIALLTMEKACLSSISFEDTTEVTGKVWRNFKESLRELKGLDALFDVITDCHSSLEGWFKNKSLSVSASKDDDSASLESVVLLLKSLKIMENATFMSEDNQYYLLKMKAKLNSGGMPLSFVGTIISCINFLSGLSLLQTIPSISDNEKPPFSASRTCMKEKITDAQDYPSTSSCGTKNSGMEKIEVCHKSHKLSPSNLEVSTSDGYSLSAMDRADCSASTSYNATLHCSKGVSCRSTIGLKVKVHANSQRPSSGWISIRSIDSKESSHGQSKRVQISNNLKCDSASDHIDPFAFDEDNSGPSKWEQFSSKKETTQTSKQAFPDNKYVNGSDIPLVVSEDESSQPTSEVNLQSSDIFCPSVDEKDSSSLEDCLLTSVKVLMNLTNDNPVGCQQIGACGGLDTLASLIASHFPSFDLCMPIATEIEDSMSSFNRSNVSELLNGGKLHDQELDFLVAILGLLVNLVEKDSLNRLRLASARVLVNQPGTSASKVIYRDVVPLLCSIFMSTQGTGEASGEEEDDEASLLQSQREAEMMIIEAYTALLLAFLSTESTSVKEAIARYLPNHRLEILVPVLERFVAFHLNLNMISPETHSAVVKVIESCKVP